MQIQQLRLRNFRGIKNLELNFDPNERFAVLVGVNGVGKSSILDCISAMVRSYGLIATDASLQGVFSDRDIYIGEAMTRNGITGVFGGRTISWDLEKSKGIDKAGDISKETVRDIKESSDQYKSSSFVAVYYFASRRAIQIQQNIGNGAGNGSGAGAIDGSGNGAGGDTVINTTYGHGISDNIREFTKTIDFKDFVHWFRIREDLENETRLSGNIDFRDPKLSAVRNAVYFILGREFSGLRMQRAIDELSDLRMQRAIDELVISKMDKAISLNWLSDGEKGLLALAGDLARRLAITYPNARDPLQGEGLVLIDEIELHLHPAWQRIIMQRLTQTFPKCQFVVTTHSPQVLSHVQPECIYSLVMDGENVVLERPERSYGRDSNRILEDIMGVSQRPPEIEEKISELFRMIHNGDISKARELIQDLASEIGIDEPELIRATTAIRRREVIGR